MSLSLKAELEAWANALSAYDAQDFPQALQLFEPIADTSRILTNIGLILATLGEHERAVENFLYATELDNYLAIAYFQAGVSLFLLNRFDEAFEQFDSAFMWLRGNQAINYEQLGLNFRLYLAEILFNRGLCLLNLGRVSEGLADLQAAQKEKVTPEHDVVDEALRDDGDGYTVFSIPVGILFRPNPNKIKNLQTKDYLGKAKLISKDGSGYRAFDGVDPSELAFKPEDRRKEGANLGRSSSDIGGTSAPKNPAGLARAATTVAVTTRPSVVDAPRRTLVDNPVPGRPSMDNVSGRPSTENGRPSADIMRRPSVDVLSNRPSLEGTRPLARAATTIRPVGPAPPPKEPIRPIDSRAAMARSPEPVMVRSPEPMGAGPGPARGLSVRRPALKATSPPVAGAVDSIYESYSSPAPGGLQRAPTVRTDDWNAPVGRAPSRSDVSRAPSRSQGSLGRSPSQYTVRRAPSRKGTIKSRSVRSYEEEEGYVSGEPEEVPFELTKIRVRLHFNDTLRGMAIMPDISCDEFMDQVCSKFGKEYGDLVLKFADEDGARITLMDESDFELAIEGLKIAAGKGKEPKLEIWCELA
ncbi:neutrophil cytosol factor 2 [Ceratobasidium sp. AG-Ba]|nr:neutrophil cytosol factor 2 [Ceratobasidium sp. AG-Ba]